MNIIRESYALSRALKSGTITEQAHIAARLLSGIRSATAIGNSASEAILYYMKANPRKIIPGEVLEAVAGTREWARSVRSLRAQGWKIATAGTPLTKNERQALRNVGIETIPNGSYVLTSLYHKWK